MMQSTQELLHRKICPVAKLTALEVDGERCPITFFKVLDDRLIFHAGDHALMYHARTGQWKEITVNVADANITAVEIDRRRLPVNGSALEFHFG